MNEFEYPGKIERQKQILEGRIDDLAGFESGDWKKVLPEGLTLHDVDLFIQGEGQKNSWYWHLKSEYIIGEEEKKKWDKERNMWTNL
jgi:hypothetical protein